jgi:hypothetical protein
MNITIIINIIRQGFIMLLTQNENGMFVRCVNKNGDSIGELRNVHPISACSSADGCAIHNRPSQHALVNAPLNWREDRNILERICVHGIGHPDHDSAKYLISVGMDYENVHGCDGCCGS